MKKSELTFTEGFLGERAKIAKSKGNKFKCFDWDKCAKIIKEKLAAHPDLKAEAGLQGDWAYTGGIIFENRKPTNDSYTYLGSVWATPTLILSWDDEEQEEVECFTDEESRFNTDSKWDATSLSLLGITEILS